MEGSCICRWHWCFLGRCLERLWIMWGVGWSNRFNRKVDFWWIREAPPRKKHSTWDSSRTWSPCRTPVGEGFSLKKCPHGQNTFLNITSSTIICHDLLWTQTKNNETFQTQATLHNARIQHIVNSELQAFLRHLLRIALLPLAGHKTTPVFLQGYDIFCTSRHRLDLVI